jgi:hypothetical protein
MHHLNILLHNFNRSSWENLLFDGMDYPKWSSNMKMHLHGLHPSIWEVVVVGVTPQRNGVPMAEQTLDYFCNVQAVRVITVGYFSDSE